MSKSNMLGVMDIKGVIGDLLRKLAGDDGRIWLQEIKRFLRKEPCWVGEVGGSLAKTIALLKNANYLDTSFEDRETHLLPMRPLSKEEALAEYRWSGGKTWVWGKLERNMPYTIPKAESLDVITMNFNRDITSDDALAEMDKLGVRPLTYEELIQYGVAYPEHQKQKVLIGLGTKHTLDGDPLAPDLRFVVDERRLSVSHWDDDWGGGCRFPVVRK